MRKLEDYVDVDPLSGHLKWKRTNGSIKEGTPVALSTRPDGYLSFMFDRKKLYHHIAIWYLCTGEWPKGEIDHINGDRSDNRLENLRVVTRRQNHMNRSSDSTSTSKYKGVSWNRQRRKWYASIKYEGKSHNLGGFDSEEEAALKYNESAIINFGEYAKLNTINDEVKPVKPVGG